MAFPSLWRLGARVRAFFRREALDRDFAQELESHIQLLTEEHVQRGMSYDEARRMALVEVRWKWSCATPGLGARSATGCSLQRVVATALALAQTCFELTSYFRLLTSNFQRGLTCRSLVPRSFRAHSI